MKPAGAAAKSKFNPMKLPCQRLTKGNKGVGSVRQLKNIRSEAISLVPLKNK